MEVKKQNLNDITIIGLLLIGVALVISIYLLILFRTFTDTINERTDYLLKNSDVCIFLPGGIGTIYEIMSSIETKRAHEHNCKIIIVNLFGYFDELIKMFDKTYKENFASIKDKNTYTIINKIEELDLINLK